MTELGMRSPPQRLKSYLAFFLVSVTVAQKYQTSDDIGQSATVSPGSYSHTTDSSNDYYSAGSTSRVRCGPKGDKGEKGESGRDGLNGMTGIPGPPGHVFMLPVIT